MEFILKSQKKSQNDGNKVQQFECEWEIVKKFTKPSPATWFEIALIYGIQVEKPKMTEPKSSNFKKIVKFTKPVPATWFEIFW